MKELCHEISTHFILIFRLMLPPHALPSCFPLFMFSPLHASPSSCFPSGLTHLVLLPQPTSSHCILSPTPFSYNPTTVPVEREAPAPPHPPPPPPPDPPELGPCLLAVTLGYPRAPPPAPGPVLLPHASPPQTPSPRHCHVLVYPKHPHHPHRHLFDCFSDYDPHPHPHCP